MVERFFFFVEIKYFSSAVNFWKVKNVNIEGMREKKKKKKKKEKKKKKKKKKKRCRKI